MFEIKGKVALVTGGASGIGLEIAKELLRNGLKACTLADIDENIAQDAIEAINQEFGKNKAIFVKTDVVDRTQFEATFKATIENFRNVDILINNAGILNDSMWEETIDVNIKGTINGILLGMEDYLQHHRSGNESVIVNLASITGIDVFISFPIYSCSKFASVGLTRAFGAEHHFERTKVRVVAVCPGITHTPMVDPARVVKNVLAPAYASLIKYDLVKAPKQDREYVAKAVVHILEAGEPGSAWVAENSEPPYEIDFPTRQQRLKK